MIERVPSMPCPGCALRVYARDAFRRAELLTGHLKRAHGAVERDPAEPEAARRPTAPEVEAREMDALFGISEDPQTGTQHIRLPGNVVDLRAARRARGA